MHVNLVHAKFACALFELRNAEIPRMPKLLCLQFRHNKKLFTFIFVFSAVLLNFVHYTLVN